METGEAKCEEFCFFPNGAELTTIVLVEHVNDYHHPDNTYQVSIECLALDSLGSVFCLDLEYFPNSVTVKDNLLADMAEGEIYVVNGGYAVIQNEAAITLYEPSYKAVEMENEDEIRQVFKTNRVASLKAIH